MALELQADDIRLVNRVLLEFPELLDLIHAIKSLLERTRLPIESLEQFAQALVEEPLTFQDLTIGAGEVRSFVPAYYFPMVNEDDVISKVLDLAARRPPYRGSLGGVMQQNAKEPASPGWEAPPSSGIPDPPILTPDELLRHFNSPGAESVWYDPMPSGGPQ